MPRIVVGSVSGTKEEVLLLRDELCTAESET